MKPRYHTKPWKHQREALRFLYRRAFGALYTTMGSGKTKVIIDLIVNKGFKTTLIVAPKKVCRVWAPQFTVHAPDEPIVVLDVSGASTDKKAGLVREGVAEAKSTNANLVIIVNYDSVWREPFKSFLLKAKLDCVVCDESHRIKTPGSKCSRALTLLGKRVKHRYLMSGTPLAQSPLDIYAQYRFLDPTIFGTSFGAFKEQYANLRPIPGTSFMMLDKKKGYKNLDELHEKMFSCAFQVEVIQDLPPTQDITIEYDMPAKSQKHYREMIKEGVAELEEGVSIASNVLSVLTKLQQITSGFLPIEDDDGEKKVVKLDSARADAFADLLDGIGPEEPVVVFAKYRKDITNIRNVVKNMGRKSSEVSGKRDTLSNWIAGKTSVLVVQISSGAEGIDLTRARYCVYYSHTQSLGQYLQSRKRVHRPGQSRPVIYYRLVAKMAKGKSVDEKIIAALDANQSLVDSIMEGEGLD